MKPSDCIAVAMLWGSEARSPLATCAGAGAGGATGGGAAGSAPGAGREIDGGASAGTGGGAGAGSKLPTWANPGPTAANVAARTETRTFCIWKLR
ncbi:hypothetical protein DXV76_17000 [Rhodobacteraceae bacterium CCMM004]|nr:hypothetical protein DXV76_17000 [Rhodobacteraceae bacterium CCMM004]